jgi:hypothetical protein
MAAKILYVFIFMSTLGSVYGGYDIQTVNVDLLTGQTISNIYSSIPYDFSGIVNEHQTIERLVLTVSADYTPGTGYIGGEYQVISSIFSIRGFDSYIDLQWYLFDQSLSCEFEVDSEKMVGWQKFGMLVPYQGYSGSVQGSFDYFIFLNKTLNTVVDNWSTLAITDATFTLYLIPEPASLLLLGIGGLLIRRKTKVFK